MEHHEIICYFLFLIPNIVSIPFLILETIINKYRRGKININNNDNYHRCLYAFWMNFEILTIDFEIFSWKSHSCVCMFSLNLILHILVKLWGDPSFCFITLTNRTSLHTHKSCLLFVHMFKNKQNLTMLTISKVGCFC